MSFKNRIRRAARMEKSGSGFYRLRGFVCGYFGILFDMGVE